MLHTALDKNIRDDLDRFTHLKSKVHFAKRSSQLADFLAKDRDIIVSTIQKFGYLQDKIQQSEALKSRRIAFLIDEAHRSQDGKMALKMHRVFTADGEYEAEDDETPNSDDIAATLEKLNISNQVCVAFTATPTPKTVAFFGEPIDIYSEEEAIQEGYNEFIVFAEVMANSLVQQGKVSELKLLLKHIQLTKGAVLYVDTVSNPGGVKEPRTVGGMGAGTGGKGMPSTTLDAAIKALETKFQISKEDAIVIREICEEVAAKAEIKLKIAHNRDNILFLEQYEPTLHSEIRMGYMDRDLWGQLQNPIYTDKGGIIPIMGKTIIQQVMQRAA